MPEGQDDWNEHDDEGGAAFEKNAWKTSRRRRLAAGTEPVTERQAGARQQGLVLSVGAKFCIAVVAGEERHCRLPSNLAARQRSDLAVGDQVEVAGQDDAFWIVAVAPRKTILSRPDPRNPSRERVIAANVETVVVVSALRRPGLRPGLIDRYLLAIERGGAAAMLAINKVDLAAGDDDPELACLTTYRQLGVPIVLCSAATGRGIEELRSRLTGRLCVLVGHSGVGKSSLLNALLPHLELTTGAVKASDGTGRHTTSRSHLYELGHGTRVIDTPGIRELGLADLGPQDLLAAFEDLQAASGACRFADCTHSHEPVCGVKAAVEQGEIPEARYAAYRRMLASLDE